MEVHPSVIDMDTLWQPIHALAAAEQAAPLNKHEGAWQVRIDDQWHIAVNGHNRAVTVRPEGGMEIVLLPFHAAVWFNGWLAGKFGAFDGMFAAGEAANAQTFAEAVRRRIEATAE